MIAARITWNVPNFDPKEYGPRKRVRFVEPGDKKQRKMFLKVLGQKCPEVATLFSET